MDIGEKIDQKAVEMQIAELNAIAATKKFLKATLKTDKLTICCTKYEDLENQTVRK